MGLVNQPSLFEGQETSVNNEPKGTKMATATANVPASTKFVTGVVRGSYVHIFSPQPKREGDEDKEPKYSITLLIPKSDVTTLNKIKAAQEAAILRKWPSKRPPLIVSTLHDGDGARPSTGEPFGPECKGNYVITASSKYKPQVVDRNRDEIIDPAMALSGDYFKISLNFFPFDQKGKRGTSAGLGNVLFYEKGEPLGGTSRASDDFADDFNA